jgi:hypothetical protein
MTTRYEILIDAEQVVVYKTITAGVCGPCYSEPTEPGAININREAANAGFRVVSETRIVSRWNGLNVEADVIPV